MSKMAFRFIMNAESDKLAASQYFHGFNQAGRLPLVIVMPYCVTNKFASTKRKLPRDLVISSEGREVRRGTAKYGTQRTRRAALDRCDIRLCP